MSKKVDVLVARWADFDYCIGMAELIEQRDAVQALAALGQDTRLSAFRRLVAAYPGYIGAGDIARGCEVPHNTMSTHLAILTRAGLVRVERVGRQMNYRTDVDGFRALVVYLAKDCCEGRCDLGTAIAADLVLDRKAKNAGRKNLVPGV